MTTERRYDIDWIRVIAIALLLIYHIAITFQPWGVLIMFIQSNEPLQDLWVPMSMLNVWRIPLLFFVSGMGVKFAIQKRNPLQLILERTKRILVPFVFGIVVIVPLHQFIWLKYYNQDLVYFISQGHLWFLGNIFVYVLLLTPLFFFLKKHENEKFHRWLQKLFGTPLGLIVIALFFALEARLVNPESFEIYARTFHGYAIGFLAFLFGFLTSFSGDAFWNTNFKWRWPIFFTAVSLYILRLVFFESVSPNYLAGIESAAWIFSVFAFAARFLNKSGRVLSYLSQAAYPVYIWHMFFLYLGAYIFLPMNMPLMLKFGIIVIFTFAGCFGIYEGVIRRVNILRLLFGLKPVERKPISYGSEKEYRLVEEIL